MSECHRLDQQSGSLVDRHDDTPSLIFFVRVSIDPQLRKGRSPTITPAVNSDISAVKVFELVVGNSPHLKVDKKRKKSSNWIILSFIFMLHKLLCVPLYENGSFLQSLGWSEREQTLGACVLINIRDTVYFIGLELPYTLLTLFRSFRFFLEESPTTNLQELGWIKVSWVGARWT